MYLKSEKDSELCEFKRKVSLNKNEKPLHGAGIEPATPAVLRQCHNQLDHPRWWLPYQTLGSYTTSIWYKSTQERAEDMHGNKLVYLYIFKVHYLSMIISTQIYSTADLFGPQAAWFFAAFEEAWCRLCLCLLEERQSGASIARTPWPAPDLLASSLIASSARHSARSFWLARCPSR